MKNNDWEDLLNDDLPLEDVKLDIELIKSLLPQYSNEKLCEMIVCDRVFGFEQRISAICMEELAKRRMAGDSFNFESYIDQVQKEFPVLDFSTPDLRTVLNQAIGRKIKI
jgi:thymidylate synthase ThyX